MRGAGGLRTVLSGVVIAVVLVLAPAPAHGGQARAFFNPDARIDQSQIVVGPTYGQQWFAAESEWIAWCSREC